MACDVAVCEQLQNAVDVALDAAFRLCPVVSLDMVKEGLDLEIVFDINRHGIEAAGRRRHRPARQPQWGRLM